MRIIARRTFDAFACVAGSKCDVCLESQDRSDLGRFRLFVKGPRRVEVAVIGDGQAVHTEIADVRNQIRNAVRSVEERVFRMRVEVNEAQGAMWMWGSPLRRYGSERRRARTNSCPLASSGCSKATEAPLGCQNKERDRMSLGQKLLQDFFRGSALGAAAREAF